MKQLIIILSVLYASSISAKSFENYFTAGTIWEVALTDTSYPEYRTTIQQYKLLDDNGTLTMYNDGKRIAFIKSEDKKVYFTNISDSTCWYLLYDFGLDINERCMVYNTSNHNDSIGMTYISSESSSYFLGKEEMKMHCENEYENHEWIPGIGGLRGPLDNYYDGQIGMNEMLLRVTHNGEEICTLKDSSIEEEIPNPSYTLSYDILTTNDPALKVYDIYGQILYWQKKDCDKYVYKLTPNNYFIIKTKTLTKKIKV